MQADQNTLIPLTELGLISATGADNSNYLQGQLTCDLPQLPLNEWSWAGHCDPKGKLIAAFRLVKLEDAIQLLMPRSLVETDLPALSKYAVFNQVEFTDSRDKYDCYGLIGPDNQAIIEAIAPGEQRVRPYAGGFILLVEQGAIIALPSGATLPPSLNELPQADSDAWVVSEVALTRPWMESTQSGEFIPQMLNLDAVGGIQYDKGCYIGQETIARMYFRGGNKRAMYTLSGDGAAADNAELELKLGDNWRRAGSIIKRIEYQGKTWLTAVLSKELEDDTEFRLGELTMVRHALPYELYK